jgi:hypothetical protein
MLVQASTPVFRFGGIATELLNIVCAGLYRLAPRLTGRAQLALMLIETGLNLALLFYVFAEFLDIRAAVAFGKDAAGHQQGNDENDKAFHDPLPLTTRDRLFGRPRLFIQYSGTTIQAVEGIFARFCS